MSSVGNPRRNARKRIPPTTRRRALELLAGSRDGCTEAIMLAHGFSIDKLVEMINAREREHRARGRGQAHDGDRPRADHGGGAAGAGGSRQVVMLGSAADKCPLCVHYVLARWANLI
jgi:hypothetical protein